MTRNVVINLLNGKISVKIIAIGVIQFESITKETSSHHRDVSFCSSLRM